MVHLLLVKYFKLNAGRLSINLRIKLGYEAADGSFKEETRGTDCVVRGKYGYVDPDVS